MSIYSVAKRAGVSTSTVSRVINEHPNVAAATVESVRRAMLELSFTPVIRSRSFRGKAQVGLKTGTIAFVVFGTSGSQPTPAFEELLRGVSDQASKYNISLIFSFVTDPTQLPPRITERRVDGILLHGERPSLDVQARLSAIPTVWLMANPQRPTWGDQVMPDNLAIGTIAANYLARRGHTRLAYLGTRASWSLELRSLAFAHRAREMNLDVEVIEMAEKIGADFWQRDGLNDAAFSLVDRLQHLRPLPTGLFVAEDRLVAPLDAAIGRSGAFSASGGNGHAHLEIISCNNERSQFAGMKRPPATIDIRAAAIGRLGVERLIWRAGNPNIHERIRSMVEPCLVEPSMNGDANCDLSSSSLTEIDGVLR
jgi:LacI family transcriptional regulator